MLILHTAFAAYTAASPRLRDADLSYSGFWQSLKTF